MSFGVNYRIKFIIPNLGEAEGELIRIKGPHLTEQFMRILPINSRGLKREQLFIIPINAQYTVEKPTLKGNKGDIIYDPQSKSLLILLDSKSFGFRVANVGKIVKNLELFEKLSISSGVRIEETS
ncbi:MAG: hypothetical protein ACTSQE_05320 [Candidatus Heimdallarchaeaceae archaeon]